MKTVLDGNGADQTAAVKAALLGATQVYTAHLYNIATANPYVTGGHYTPTFRQSWNITDADRPLHSAYWGTFQPATIKRGALKFSPGLEVDTLELDWYFPPDLNSDGTTNQNNSFIPGPGSSPIELSVLEGFAEGFFDGALVKMWKAYMPTYGDISTWGAAPYFRGIVADMTIDRSVVKMKVNSLLDWLNSVQIPRQVIEPYPRSILVQTGGQDPGLSADGGPVTSATVIAGSTETEIICSETAPNAGHIFPDGALDFGTAIFFGPALGGLFRDIRHNTSVVISSVTYNVLYLYKPLPFLPAAGTTLALYVSLPNTFPTGAFYDIPGWPYVPRPETAV